VIDYFNHTIEYYIQDSVPNIEKHLNAFITISCGTDHKELQLCHEIFLQIKTELSLHLQKEMSQTADYPHELLNDLKNILIRLVSASYNQNLCYAVIFSINSLQKDLCILNRLKTKILEPKLKELNEKELDVLKLSAKTPKENSDEKKIKLTPREEEVLKLIATGCLNKEIADRLNISLNTVLTHRKNIIAKTGIKTVSGLTFYCISNGLLSSDFIPEQLHKKIEKI
jgi:DNA-binding CsgD family transcriptional regulator